MKILTTYNYWQTIPNSTKSYWRKVATRFPNVVICTGRPNLRTYRGGNSVRRASTGGKYGKSADIVRIDINRLTKETSFNLIEI